MTPWFETLGVVLIAGLGILLGRLFSKIRKPYWVLGYFVPLVLLGILGAVGCSYAFGFIRPNFWFATGRIKFVVLSLAVTMGLTCPLSRLPRRAERVIVCILMAVVVVWFSVLPFLAPALLKGRHSNLRTRVDAGGVCFQSTDYTCAPAAAVTALGKLGIEASEGEMAVLSHTSPVAGTLPWCLYKALQSRYGADGLECQLRRFDSVEQLENAGITLAAVKDTFLSDHCVAILGVSGRMVSIADPVAGERLLSYEQFERIWRFSGIVLKRNYEREI